MMSRLLLITFMLLLFIQQARSQDLSLSFLKNDNDICNAIVSLRMGESDSLLQLSELQERENLMHEVHYFYKLFITAFISEKNTDHLALQANKKSLISKLESLEASNPLKRWAIAKVYLQSAFARLKFNEQYAAAWEIRKAYFLVLENQALFPEVIQNELIYGLLKVMIGSVPPQYQWVVKLVSMEGDVVEGREIMYALLNKLKSKPELSCLRAETLFFLSFTEMNLQSDREKAKQLLEFFQPHDNNCPLLVYAKSTLEMRSGLNDAAFLTLSGRIKDGNQLPFNYLDFLMAETKLRKLDPDAAKDYTRFIQGFEGNNYKRDAARKIAWIGLIQGDTLQYQQGMLQLANMPEGMVEADQEASKEAVSKVVPNVPMLKARLLFDGGYLIRAKSLLLSLKAGLADFTQDDRLRYYYQLARVEHDLGNTDLALIYYQQVISLGSASPLYFAAASALRSGEIHEARGDLAQAEQSYNQCLKLKPDTYRQGLHLKAKASLSRLKNKK